MGRRSTIEQMPPEILDKLQTLLRDPRINQLEATAKINAVLASIDHEVVSKSAVNRYAQKMAKVGQKLQETREVTRMYIDRFGEDQLGDVGKVINEIIRTVIFEVTMKIQGQTIDPEFAPEIAKMLKNLADAMQKLEQAAATNTKREREIKRLAREKAAEDMEKIAKEGGISAETVLDIKRKLLNLPV